MAHSERSVASSKYTCKAACTSETLLMKKQLAWQVVKRLWEYIKAHDLQNPKDKRKIVLDERLRTLFKPPLNMLNMNKQLSRHVYVEGERPRDCRI